MKTAEEVLPPRGLPVSGRAWKTVAMKRSSAKHVTNPMRSTWEEKMQAKAVKADLKSKEAEVKKMIKDKKDVRV